VYGARTAPLFPFLVVRVKEIAQRIEVEVFRHQALLSNKNLPDAPIRVKQKDFRREVSLSS
jgi:hypothetical protein